MTYMSATLRVFCGWLQMAITRLHLRIAGSLGYITQLGLTSPASWLTPELSLSTGA